MPKLSRFTSIGYLAGVLLITSGGLASAADGSPAEPAESTTGIVDQVGADAARVADKAAEIGESAAEGAGKAADATAEEAESLFEQAKERGKRAYEWSKQKLDEFF